jgi:hypothetical protein
MLLGFAVAYPEAPETQRRGAVVAIEARSAAYSTSSLAAPVGQVTVVLTNHDLFWHTFTIDQLHVDLEARWAAPERRPSPPHLVATGSTAGSRPMPRPAWAAP